MAFCTCMAYGSQKAVLETVKGTLTLSHSHPFSAMYILLPSGRNWTLFNYRTITWITIRHKLTFFPANVTRLSPTPIFAERASIIWLR